MQRHLERLSPRKVHILFWHVRTYVNPMHHAQSDNLEPHRTTRVNEKAVKVNHKNAENERFDALKNLHRIPAIHSNKTPEKLKPFGFVISWF